MSDEDYPEKCPECGSKNFTGETHGEYTGGGFSDYWDEFECEDCGNTWRSGKKSGYM